MAPILKKPGHVSFKHYLIISLLSTGLFLCLGFFASRLIIEKSYGPPPPKATGELRAGTPPPRRVRAAITVASILVAALLSVAASLIALVYYLLKKAALAEAVMADQIQGLVLQVKATDNERRQLAQEISQDLKTPLASLRLISESLERNFTQLSEHEKRIMLTAIRTESHHMGDLLNDLLFLAMAGDPQFTCMKEKFSLRALIDSELPVLQSLYPEKKFLFEDFTRDGEIEADPALLKRAIRNALDNAAAFASARLRVELKAGPAGTDLTIEDDGPGLEPEVLEQYGKKRFNRGTEPAENGRSSTGLGAVVFKRILDLHGARFRMMNRPAEEQATGSRLQITFANPAS